MCIRDAPILAFCAVRFCLGASYRSYKSSLRRYLIIVNLVQCYDVFAFFSFSKKFSIFLYDVSIFLKSEDTTFFFRILAQWKSSCMTGGHFQNIVWPGPKIHDFPIFVQSPDLVQRLENGRKGWISAIFELYLANYLANILEDHSFGDVFRCSGQMILQYAPDLFGTRRNIAKK